MLISFLDEAGVDKVVLTAGELGSTKSYDLPDIVNWFPNNDVMYGINRVIRLTVALTVPAGHPDARNAHNVDRLFN